MTLEFDYTAAARQAAPLAEVAPIRTCQEFLAWSYLARRANLTTRAALEAAARTPLTVANFEVPSLRAWFQTSIEPSLRASTVPRSFDPIRAARQTNARIAARSYITDLVRDLTNDYLATAPTQALAILAGETRGRAPSAILPDFPSPTFADLPLDVQTQLTEYAALAAKGRDETRAWLAYQTRWVGTLAAQVRYLHTHGQTWSTATSQYLAKARALIVAHVVPILRHRGYQGGWWAMLDQAALATEAEREQLFVATGYIMPHEWPIMARQRQKWPPTLDSIG